MVQNWLAQDWLVQIVGLSTVHIRELSSVAYKKKV
jgi:hypothetical protein